MVFPNGNLSPEGSGVKSTALAPEFFVDGKYKHRGAAKVFVTEDDAIKAIKDGKINEDDVIVLLCRGPLGAGMPETA